MPVTISGTDGITSPTITTTGVIVSGTTVADATAVIRPLVSATSVASTSGTSIDFTGIPSWVKRITVMFNAVSTNGSSLLQIQLGDSGGVETTGYVSLVTGLGTQNNLTSGLLVIAAGNAGYVITGLITIINLGSNSYVSSTVTTTDASLGNGALVGAGRKTLSDTLDRVRITTVNGTDAFDAGSINILYE